jgi:ketosteroid isomerase-like protein
MSEQDNIALVRQAYTNFKTGNIDALLNQFADDITWELPKIESTQFGGKRNGKAQVGEFFQLVNKAQESLDFDPRDFIAQGDRVVALGSYRWRVRETGREFTSDFAHAWTIKNGKATAFHEYTDTAAAERAHQKALTA